jgi:hypothetical protein
MLTKYFLATIIFIVCVGIIFIGLDILDINEDLQLHLPINILNTIFISTIAAFLIYYATELSKTTGSHALLALGCAQLVFGVGSLLRGWITGAELYILINMYESLVIIASLIYLVGGVSVMTGRQDVELKPGRKNGIIFWSYIGVMIVMSLIIALAFQRAIPESIMPGITLQNVLQGISALLLLASSIIYLRVYSKTRTDLYYWYFLGLISLAVGVFFISQGQVESKIAWTGRVAQYFGNLCFIIGVISVKRQLHHKDVNMYYLRNIDQGTIEKI